MGTPAPQATSGCEDEDTVELAPNLVPDIDQETPVATYPDWKHEDTKVVSYTIIHEPEPVKSTIGDRWAASRAEAKADAEARFGRVFEANYVPGRAFFRVKR